MPHMTRIAKILYIISEGIIEIFFYECRDYESVDELIVIN